MTQPEHRPIAPPAPPVQLEEPQLTFLLKEVTPLIRLGEARQQFGVSGAGLTAAILDTGIRASHVDFGKRVRAQRNFTADNGGNTDDARDGQGHGTHVAGIVAANGDHVGVAPGAHVAALKVLPNAGDGSFDAIRDALQWVLDNHAAHGISVVCMSLSDQRNHTSDATFAADPVRRRIRELRAARVPVVVAAGNEYFTHGSRQGMGFPGICRECVSVGAVYDASEGPMSYASGAIASSTAPDRLTPFSQRLHESVSAEAHTDIFAPGAPVTSTGIANDHGESIQDGTSQAAPVVAGVILLAQELFRRHAGTLPEVNDLVSWLRLGGVKIVDGDDEQDNVKHTSKTFLRVDAFQTLDAVRRHIQRQFLLAAGAGH